MRYTKNQKSKRHSSYRFNKTLSLVRFPRFLDMVKCGNKTQDCDVNVMIDNTRGSYNGTCKLIGYTVGGEV